MGSNGRCAAHKKLDGRGVQDVEGRCAAPQHSGGSGDELEAFYLDAA